MKLQGKLRVIEQNLEVIEHNNLKVVAQEEIEAGFAHAKRSPRGRSAILLSSSFSEKPQRFINCLDSSTYVRPHQHFLHTQWEFMSWISGEIVALVFNRDGKVLNKIALSEKGTVFIEFPPNTVHTFYTLARGAYLEVRNCAYQPSVDRVYLPWAPEEESDDAEAFLNYLKTLEIGDSAKDFYQCQAPTKNTKVLPINS